jgi:hypothetical protein
MNNNSIHQSALDVIALETIHQENYEKGTKKQLLNPFNALYNNDNLLSERPEIQELDQYARDLENQIEGDFNLEYLTFEFAYNQLGFVRNGLLLAKIKFLKLYKNYGDGTFASFCQKQLKKQRWQINDTIRASRVVLELMYAGFAILPTNIAQAIALAKLTGDELIAKWHSIINTIPPDKITAHTIGNTVKPPTESERAVATIKVPAAMYEDIHSEAAERGLSIVEWLRIVLDFFLNGGNSHLLQLIGNTVDYTEKERIWQQDLEQLVVEGDNSLSSPSKTKYFN